MTAQPFHQPQVQPWAEDQFRRHRNEVLYGYGEYVMFVLLWHPQEETAGLVGRCHSCFIGEGRSAAAYSQGARKNCPVCFGTTFEGGYRARIVRPALVTDSNSDSPETRRGSLKTDTVTVETTSDFSFRRGDFIFRAGGYRYQAEEGVQVVLRTGMGFPDETRSAAQSIPGVRLEDPSAVAYLVPPAHEILDPVLRLAVVPHLPPALAALEDVRGPLRVP